MPAKHKASAPKTKPAELVWIVNSNGQQIEVSAEELEITDHGALLFTEGGDLAQAYAPGHWGNVVSKKVATPV